MEQALECEDFSQRTDPEELQRILNAEKTKVEEQRNALKGQRRAMRQELDDARWQALWSLQLEQKNVHDLIQQASEASRISGASPPAPFTSHSQGQMALSGAAAPEGPVAPIDMDRKGLRRLLQKGLRDRPCRAVPQAAGAGRVIPNCIAAPVVSESQPSAHLDAAGLEQCCQALPADASHRSPAAMDLHEFQSPPPSTQWAKEHLEFFSPSPTASTLVLTRGLARRLLEELRNAAEGQKPSVVLENFGLGRGPEAKLQVEEAMRPHLDRDSHLRQQWMEVVWA